MSQPQFQNPNPIIAHKLAQIAEFEAHAVAIEGFAARATDPERATQLLEQADIARRQVLQIRAEIALQEQYSNNHGEDEQS